MTSPKDKHMPITKQVETKTQSHRQNGVVSVTSVTTTTTRYFLFKGEQTETVIDYYDGPHHIWHEKVNRHGCRVGYQPKP